MAIHFSNELKSGETRLDAAPPPTGSFRRSLILIRRLPPVVQHLSQINSTSFHIPTLAVESLDALHRRGRTETTHGASLRSLTNSKPASRFEQLAQTTPLPCAIRPTNLASLISLRNGSSSVSSVTQYTDYSGTPHRPR